MRQVSSNRPAWDLSLRLLSLLWLLFLGLIVVLVGIGRTADGATLAFTSKRSGVAQIYLLDVGQRASLQLTDARYASSFAAWAVGGRLAYASFPSPLHLSVMDVPTGKITRFSPTGGNEYQPAWSPSGRLAAATDQMGSWDIVLYDSEGERQLASFNSAQNEIQPNWCSDNRLLFVSDRDGTYNLYLYDFAARRLINLTHSSDNSYNPACSPDGRQLAFTSTRGMNADIYVTDLMTGATDNVTHNPASDFSPAWLPGGQLAFVSDRDGNREIYLLDVAGGRLTNLTQNPADDEQPALSR